MPFQAPMSAEQRVVLGRTVAAVRSGDFSTLGQQLQEEASLPWLPPPLLTVAAALLDIIVAGRQDQVPWLVTETLWEQYLPDRIPSGRSEWRNAHYALHAAGCLAAGLWLDVERQESFWHLPLWPFTLDLIELLVNVAAAPPVSLSAAQLAVQLQAQLDTAMPSRPEPA